MRIFNSFIIVAISAILFMLPFTEAVYDFQTDLEENTFYVTTGSGITTANITLLTSIYGADTSTVTIESTINEVPALSSYNSTSKTVTVAGLTAATSRTLTVYYDVDALGGSDAINTLVSRVPWILLLSCIAFAPAAIVAIWMGRA